MKTQIICKTKEQLNAAIKKCEKYNISYSKNRWGLMADITPERAWNISLI